MKSYSSKALTTLVLSLVLSTSAFGGVIQTGINDTPPSTNGVIQTGATANGTRIGEADENTTGTLSAMDVVLGLLRHVLTMF